MLEAARGTVGAFLGARPDDVVVFGRNTTDALNLLAAAVPGEVVCLDVEHHANLLPWRARRVGARARRRSPPRSPRSPRRCAPGPPRSSR